MYIYTYEYDLFFIFLFQANIIEILSRRGACMDIVNLLNFIFDYAPEKALWMWT